MADARTHDGVDIGPYGPSGRSLRSRIDRDLAHAINHLIRLGHDLAGAYRMAIEEVESDELRESLRVLAEAHHKRIEALSEHIHALGAEPARHGDLRGLLEKGRVFIARHKGDREIIKAMASNEAAMLDGYREVNATPGLPEKIRDVVASAVIDEGRRRALFDRMLQRFVG